MKQSRGQLFVISAPSGAGKTSLVTALCQRMPDLAVAVSYTTRARRVQEQDAVHYHFVDQSTFAEMLNEQAFLEHAEVFGNHYGTSRSSVEASMDRGLDVILEIDWQGAAQVRAAIECTGVFVLPPSMESLAARLKGRAQDNPEVINRRMLAARTEISHYREFDFLVVNDEFERAITDLESIVRSVRLKRARQEPNLTSLIRELLGDTHEE